MTSAVNDVVSCGSNIGVLSMLKKSSGSWTMSTRRTHLSAQLSTKSSCVSSVTLTATSLSFSVAMTSTRSPSRKDWLRVARRNVKVSHQNCSLNPNGHRTRYPCCLISYRKWETVGLRLLLTSKTELKKMSWCASWIYLLSRLAGSKSRWNLRSLSDKILMSSAITFPVQSPKQYVSAYLGAQYCSCRGGQPARPQHYNCPHNGSC